MSRANLMRIVDTYNLYPRDRATKTAEELVERLTKGIKLDLLRADAIDPRGGGKSNATIAFSLSYEGETPAVAQKVANELATLFLSQNLKTREQKAAETSAFLGEEADKLSAHVSETETQLARFKEKHAGRLPEQVTLNMQIRDRTDGELKEVDRQIGALEEREFYLDGQLSQMNPNLPLTTGSGERILDPGDRLKALKAQLATLSSTYSSNHPDVVKVRRMIDALEKEAGSAGDTQEQSKQLPRARADLAAMREKYSDDHPDVVKLKRTITTLEAQQPAQESAGVPAVKVQNPTFIALRAQLESIRADLKSLRSKRPVLQSKLASLDKRLEQTPEVEREYLELTRDHEASLVRYRDIRAKQMQADIGQELEKDRKAERFSLIEPPQVPERPSSPNRQAILLVGLILSVGSGLGSAGVLEALDHSVRGSRALTAILDVPVLAVVPYMEDSLEDSAKIPRRRMLLWIVVLSSVATLVLVMLLVHIFFMPLDVLWFRALRSLQAYVPALASIPPSPADVLGIVWSA